MTPSASSESVGVDADEQIAEWILSCPISLGTELPGDLLSILISISTGTSEYPQRSTPPGPTFRKCLKHIDNAIAGQPTAQPTAQSAKEGHVEDLNKISNNLLTLSQKLCDTLRCSADLHCLSEAPKFPEAPKVTQGIIEKGWCSDDKAVENSQWNASEFILPYGFDSVMELLSSETT
ncbi:hypothetical protein N7510_001413 [Penicillium lagena]|uniref:uncharacterized protein n=1 Tax=Penicillium lagena TaxID=94218 RepID=UPI0025406AF5|nr:uncharacterized protein N7510_001413 [Penicillium lagena]KAJ5625104.1 hypothetical protein N7510_001413 [Penicillium lagena]